ncbi:hypothetical protein DUGA2_34750 [Duganella sp. HH101]|nr:hypothetical protein DUGA2_34750 [Duganella sp. HH101]
MSLLHSPNVLVCATLTKMFVDQFVKLNDEERIVVIEKFCLEINSVFDSNLSPKHVPGSNLKSHEEN